LIFLVIFIIIYEIFLNLNFVGNMNYGGYDDSITTVQGSLASQGRMKQGVAPEFL